jgi:predicted Fe-Mo cluster-binding NifX family protein
MSNWKKIIFLDVDGVVNSDNWYNKTRGRSGDFDPEAIALLNQLEAIGAEVVISSSWGESADKPLKDVGLKLPIVGHTEHFYQDLLTRGNEIEKWIQVNFGGMGTRYGVDDDGFPYYRKHYGDNIQDYEYVIFDDDSDFLLGQVDNFIRTDRLTGLTQADIDKAIKILNREN